MLYIAVQDQFYTFTMFDAQALWALKYVTGHIHLPGQEAMEADWKSWVQRYLFSSLTLAGSKDQARLTLVITKGQLKLN